MKKYIYKFIQITFLFVFLLVNFIILFDNTKITISFLFNNVILIFLGILILLMIIFVIKKIEIDFSNTKILFVLSIILFMMEIFISFNTLFKSGWDVSMIYDAAYSNVFYNYPKISFEASKSYFEMYPNNTFLLLYEMFWAFITRSICKGPITLNFILVFNNCIIFTLVGIMIYLCTKKIINNDKMALLSWLIYIILVGTSPWFLVPYSDSIGLLFPTLLLYIYLYFNGKLHFKTFLISLVSFIGYQIKPQILIVFIAIILIEFSEIFSQRITKDYCIKIGKKIVIIGLTYILVAMPISYIQKDVMKLDSNRKIGLTHFLMMGLNTKTNGVWSGEDVSFSSSFPNEKIRRQQNLKKVKERIKEQKILGLIKHLRNKVVVNFNDGTFYFGQEGSFYTWYYFSEPNKNNFIANCIYSTGKYYIYFSSIRQAIWLLILFLMLFCYTYKNNKEILLIQLSLIGLFLFEMLFEARSRYLFIYVPYFIMLAILGINKILLKLKVEV